MDKIYHLYISYSWLCHPDACKKKVKFLDKAGIKYKFLEIYNQELQADETIEHKMEKAIKFSDCLLLLAGVEDDCYEQLESEINFARKHGKPIIAIEPWARKDTKEIIKENAQHIVGWHGKLIADAIRYSDHVE